MVKVLLKKVCLVVSVLLGLGSNVQAQETSVTFNVSDEGKTLTISGQGDLKRIRLQTSLPVSFLTRRLVMYLPMTKEQR